MSSPWAGVGMGTEYEPSRAGSRCPVHADCCKVDGRSAPSLLSGGNKMDSDSLLLQLCLAEDVLRFIIVS